MRLLFFLFTLCVHLIGSEEALLCQQQYSRLDELPVCNEAQKTIRTIYGTFFVEEPVIWELINSPVLQRIKQVHQYGIANYVESIRAYSRFDHSVGVWALLRLYGASLEEQIAGLLHDASHTVFSHTGDYLFLDDTDEAYQDGIHRWYLKQQKVDEILARHGMTLDDVLHKSGLHHALEQDLPDLCADRIEYNIQEGLMNGMIKADEVSGILKALFYEDGVWFLTDIGAARMLGLVSLHGTKVQWGGPNTYIQNILAAKALRRALELEAITFDDIHFSVDLAVWQVLVTSSDPILKEQMFHLQNYKKTFAIGSSDDYDILVRTKLRGVNPWIQLPDGTMKRLVEVDEVYSTTFQSVKELTITGWYLKWQQLSLINFSGEMTLSASLRTA